MEITDLVIADLMDVGQETVGRVDRANVVVVQMGDLDLVDRVDREVIVDQHSWESLIQTGMVESARKKHCMSRNFSTNLTRIMMGNLICQN